MLGGFTVTKHVTGETGGYVADSTFTVSYTCSNGTDGTLTLKDGQTGAVSGLPLLTTCALSETCEAGDQGRQLRLGHRRRGIRRATLTIVANDSGNTVAFVLTNPLVPGAGWLHRDQARDR